MCPQPQQDTEAGALSPSAPARKRKRRWARRLGLALGGILALLALLVVVVPLVLPESLVGRIAASKIGEKLGREAAVEGARLSVFSGFRARGIRIRRREGFGEGHLATIGLISARLNYRALLGGSLRIEDVRVEDVEAHLIRDRRGVLNIQDILDQPREGKPVRIGRVQARNLRLHLDDRARGLSETVTTTEADISPVVSRKRSVRAQVVLASGGTVAVSGEVQVTAEGEQFDEAALHVQAASVGVGKLAAGLLRHALRDGQRAAQVEPTLLDADLHVGASAHRTFSAKGSVALRQFPPIAELRLEEPGRAVELTLEGRGSPDDFDLRLDLATRPARTVHVKLLVDDRLRKKGAGAFELENFFVDALVELTADLPHGLARTPLTAGRTALAMTAKGGTERLVATLKTSLEDARAQLPGRPPTPLPRVAFETEATTQLTESGLLVEVPRWAASTEGLTLRGSVRALRPPRSDQVALRAEVTSQTDFTRLPSSLVDLLRMPVAGGTLAGTLSAHTKAELDLGVERSPDGLVLRPGSVTAEGRLDLKEFALTGGARPVPPSDLAAQFHVVADVRKLAARFTDTVVRGSGVAGELKGAVSLAADAEPATLSGDLRIDLAEVARRYGVLLGVPADLDVTGDVAWQLHAEQQGETLLARGQATVTDLLLGGPAWKGEPVREPKAELAHHVEWDRRNGRVTIETFRLDSAPARAAVAGAVALPGGQGESNLTVDARVDAGVVRLVRGFLPARVRALKAGGEVTAKVALKGAPSDLRASGSVAWDKARLELADASAAGTLQYDFEAQATGEGQRRTVAARGTARLKDLVLASPQRGVEPVQEPAVSVTHDVQLDLPGGLLAVPRFQLQSRRLEATAQGRLVLPGGEAEGPSRLELRGSADTSLVTVARAFLPEAVADLEASGKATTEVVLTASPERTTATGTVAWPGARVKAGGVAVATSLENRFEATLEGPALHLKGQGTLADFAGTSPRLAGKAFREERVQLDYDLVAHTRDRRVSLSRLDVAGKLIRLACRGVASEDVLDLKVQGQAATDLAALVPHPPALLEKAKLAGPVAVDVHLTGKPSAPQLAGHVDGRAVDVALGDLFRKQAGVAARVEFDAGFNDSVVDLRKAVLELAGARASARLKAPTDLSKLEGHLEATDLDVAALAALSPVATPYKPAGTVGVTLDVGGSIRKPLATGRVTLKDCAAQLPDRPQLRPVLNAALATRDTDLTLESVTVALGDHKLSLAGIVRGATTFPNTEADLVVESPGLNLDQILATVRGGAPAGRPPAQRRPGWQIGEGTTVPGAAPGQAPAAALVASREPLFPDVPPELKARLRLDIGEIVVDKRKVAKLHVQAALDRSVVSLKPVTAEPMGGTLEITGNLALGGDHLHALNVKLAGASLDQDFDLLARVPFFNLLVAALGGTPETLEFVASLDAKLTSIGNHEAALRQTAAGQGTVVLHKLHVKGSPMLRLLATLAKHPEFADMTFARVDIPFTIADGTLSNTVTMPYEEGQFFAQGTTRLPTEQVAYEVTIRNPKGIQHLPDYLVEYVDAGNPLMRVGGTLSAPRPAMPTLQDILRFLAERKLKGKADDLFRGILERDRKKD